jgi:hypothetical protein
MGNGKCKGVEMSEQIEQVELKPCPFCGSIKHYEFFGCIECLSCGAQLAKKNRWNTRPIEDMLLKRVEIAEAEFANYQSKFGKIKELSLELATMNMTLLKLDSDLPLKSVKNFSGEIKRLTDLILTQIGSEDK